MSNPQDDAAFKALRSAALDLDPPIPPDLLLDLYTIQRNNQYNDDRQLVISEMSKRIVRAVDEAQG